MDLATTVLGQDIDWPVFMSPTGMTRLFHYEGERATCRAAHKAGTMLSFMSHPSWGWNYLTSEKFQLSNVADRVSEGTGKLTSVIDYINKQFDRSITWEDAEKIIQAWGGPFAIKGVMSVEDAKRAVDVGASAVMISNHGGRQLDGSTAPFDQLPTIVDAVGDQIEVILDGGVRRGTHVLKALAMGAKACMIGRGYLYALAAGGQPAVDRALARLRQEIERDMVLMGCSNLSELNRNKLYFD